MQAKQLSQHDKTCSREAMPACSARKSQEAKVVRLSAPGQKTRKRTVSYDFSGIAG